MTTPTPPSDDELRKMCERVLENQGDTIPYGPVARALLARLSESAPEVAEIEKLLRVAAHNIDIDMGDTDPINEDDGLLVASQSIWKALDLLRLLRARGRTPPPTRAKIYGVLNEIYPSYDAQIDAILKLFHAEEPTQQVVASRGGP